jgi:hypothetical protein
MKLNADIHAVQGTMQTYISFIYGPVIYKWSNTDIIYNKQY